MVTVFIWNFMGSNEAWGHASLQVDSTYVSWWPEAEGRQSKLGSSIPIYSVSPIRNRTYDMDYRGENFKHADHKINIKGLNEEAIKDWWAGFGLVRNGELLEGPLLPWSTLKQNCSTVVAKALEVGGAKEHVGWSKSWNLIWKPNDVYQYAVELKKVLDEKNKLNYCY